MSTTNAVVTPRARVLIVEDNFPVADSLRMLLESEGYKVVGLAGNLRKAEAAVEKGGFDIAVLDILLGAESVAPVAARIEASGTPIIYISGYLDAEVLPESSRRHPRLDKPCDPRLLITTIEALLAARRGTP